MKTKIEFKPIADTRMHGVTATVGDRVVEVVRVQFSEWTIFRAIGGKTVNGQKHPSGPDTDRATAMRAAREFLTSSEPLATWDNVSDIGKRA
jgi:hypothetical protein